METTKLTVRPQARIHPAVERLSGLVPSEVDAEEVYLQHILEKHR